VAKVDQRSNFIESAVIATSELSKVVYEALEML